MFAAPSQSLQQVIRDLDKAFKNFFRGWGYPKFKSKYKDMGFRLPQGIRPGPQLSKTVGTVKLPKVGVVRYKKSQEIEGEIKYVTISKVAGEWYISFCCEVIVYPKPGENISKVGLDRGVKKNGQCSDGRKFSGLRPSGKKIARLKRLQRQQAKKKKGSANRKKINEKIRRLCHHIANARKDAIHKITTELAKNHGLVVLEKLLIKYMTKSAKGTREAPGKNVRAKAGLNKAILRQGWGMLAVILEYKMLWSGGEVAYVDARYTSQKCSECGYTSKKNRKTQAQFRCLKCGHEEDADLNASKNILAAHLEAAGHAVIACGVEPEEMEATMKQELKMRKPNTAESRT